MGDLAAQQPRRLACHAQLARELRRRGRLLHRGQQPDRQQPLAQVGARLVEQGARGHRRLVAAARALIEPAAAQVPGCLVSAARTAEALPPALLEKRPPDVRGWSARVNGPCNVIVAESDALLSV